MTQINIFTKQGQTHRHREQTYGGQGGGKRVGKKESLGLVEANYCK